MLMTDISLTGGGGGAVTGAQGASTVGGPPSAATGTGAQDTIGASPGKASKGTANAYSPELMQALFVLWFGTNGNNMVLQNATATGAAGIGGVSSSGSSSKAIDPELFNLQTKNALNEICINMLNAWSKSVKENGEAIKREMNSQVYKDWEARHGKLGYEAWMNTLSPEQRLQVEQYPNFDQRVKLDQGMSLGLSDYLNQIKTSTDPVVNRDLPFLASTLAISGGVNLATGAIPDTLSSQILVQPIKDATDRILVQNTGTQAAELGYIGGLFAAGAAYFSFGQTLVKAAAPPPEINYEFAKNYAQKVLDLVNGSQFNSLAMALVTASTEEGGSLSEERTQQQIQKLKIVLLSTALALLYKTESSFKGQGGGITGKEFLDMVNGNDGLLDSPLKKDLVAQLRTWQAQLPKGESDQLLASIGAYVDQARGSGDLIDVGGLLENIKFGAGAPPESAIEA